MDKKPTFSTTEKYAINPPDFDGEFFLVPVIDWDKIKEDLEPCKKATNLVLLALKGFYFLFFGASLTTYISLMLGVIVNKHINLAGQAILIFLVLGFIFFTIEIVCNKNKMLRNREILVNMEHDEKKYHKPNKKDEN